MKLWKNVTDFLKNEFFVNPKEIYKGSQVDLKKSLFIMCQARCLIPKGIL